MQCNVQALTSAIVAAVSKAVKEAMTSQQQTDHNSMADRQVDRIVDGETASITQGMQGANLQLSSVGGEECPQQIFTSIGINLGAQVSTKLKAKIWAITAVPNHTRPLTIFCSFENEFLVDVNQMFP